MIRTLCSLGAVLLCITACGGSEEATRGGYSDICTSSDDCEKGLECASGICTALCSSDADCGKFSGNAKCMYRCFEKCKDSVPCQRLHPSLQCVLYEADN